MGCKRCRLDELQNSKHHNFRLIYTYHNSADKLILLLPGIKITFPVVILDDPETPKRTALLLLAAPPTIVTPVIVLKAMPGSKIASIPLTNATVGVAFICGIKICANSPALALVALPALPPAYLKYR